MKKITIRQLVVLIITFFICCGDSPIDQVPTQNYTDRILPERVNNNLFFNTQFLGQYEQVANTLISQKGFQEVYFLSSDNVCLNGLWRQSTDSPYTIIFCAGFYPGRKEGLASFVEIAPPDCNILFFDARGHGKSNGRFFSNIHNYGIDEYKDIIGAVEFVKKETNGPIFIHGICAGAFNAAHALAQISAQEYRVKGLIFDSGIISIPEACHVPEKYFCQKIIPTMLMNFFPKDTKETIKERFLYKVLAFTTGTLMNLATILIKPLLQSNESQTKLTADHLNKIQCPIFFIHSNDDSYCPLQNIQDLTEKVPCKTCWWINQSEHALNHIKHKNEYQKQLNMFLSSMLV